MEDSNVSIHGKHGYGSGYTLGSSVHMINTGVSRRNFEMVPCASKGLLFGTGVVLQNVQGYLKVKEMGRAHACHEHERDPSSLGEKVANWTVHLS
ncbi:hypothetical protein POTOM_038050 [Populus tomentosa]|uniref:Uncharacterized protein n=1 Tax=Populus tomentosa TaxID=118781 RepID=A0A8X7YW11_POPTO|nr:hypothetical protein POTOM_038050 [Populus tomentosa]